MAGRYDRLHHTRDRRPTRPHHLDADRLIRRPNRMGDLPYDSLLISSSETRIKIG